MDDLDVVAADLKRPHKRFSLAPRWFAKPEPVQQPSTTIADNVLGARSDEELKQYLSQNAGEKVLITFGSTWCHSCHSIFPHLYKLTSKDKVKVEFNWVGSYILHPRRNNRLMSFKKAKDKRPWKVGKYPVQFPGLKYVIAQIDYMREGAEGVEYTPTFRVVDKGKTVDQFFGADQQMLKDRLWLHAD